MPSPNSAPVTLNRIIILTIYESDPLKLAQVRGLLSGYYISEVNKTFYVSCGSDLRTSLKNSLDQNQIRYALIYINAKGGNRFLENCFPPVEAAKMEKILTNSN